MPNFQEFPKTTVELIPLGDYITEGRISVKDLQRIGRAAWIAQLPDRSMKEIESVYNPKDPRLVADQARLISTLRQGEYLGAVVSFSDSSVRPRLAGYGAIKRQVSGNPAQRFLKTKILRRPPYAAIPTINVLPEYQRLGVGSSLMWGLTRSRHIGEHMIPTAYVFDENPSGLNFFDRLGFVQTPAEQQAAPQIDYFGPNTVSPEMWRLQANNVIVTQTKILENIERKNTRVDFNNTGGNLVIEIKR